MPLPPPPPELSLMKTAGAWPPSHYNTHMAVGGSRAVTTNTAVLFSLQSLCLMHTGKPTGVALSHCITWFQPQLILTKCQVRNHRHFGIIVAPDSSEF